jgi:hypothetical protein
VAASTINQNPNQLMFSKKYLIPLIVTLAAVTIGGGALAYNNFKPKNEVAKLTTTSLSSSSLVSKSESSNSTSKISSVSSTGSIISQGSSSSNSSQTEVKKVPVEVESPPQEEPSETKSNTTRGSQPLTKVTKNIPSDNCTLPDLAGYDVLLTQKGCLYFKQFDDESYAKTFSLRFVNQYKPQLTKILQDIAGIHYDKYFYQIKNKKAFVEIKNYGKETGGNVIIAGFSEESEFKGVNFFDLIT